MSTVRIVRENEMSDFIDILFEAYPMIFFPTAENRQEMTRYFSIVQHESSYKKVYGLFRDGQMLGGMLLNDFTMTVLSQRLPLGGVGSVAVDFLHKKEKVAKEMVAYFLAHFRERGYGMVALYPFRPDFYKKMGFGYGPKMHRYRVKPADLLALPAGKDNLCYVGRDDLALLLACHNRIAAKTHGMIEKQAQMLELLFVKPEIRAVGYLQEGKLTGYVIYRFEKEDDKRFLLYDMYIEELIYEDVAALHGLLTFLSSQQDQVKTLIFDTQDEYFHFLIDDVRAGTNEFIGTLSHVTNTQGLGIMYRVIDVAGIFSLLHNHNFNDQHCRVKFTVADDFLAVNNQAVIVHFKDGQAKVIPEGCYEAEVFLDIANFSSLLMGTVTFRSLYQYGLAKISDEKYVAIINSLFMVSQKPQCTVRF
ncbi:MAG: GNAT family N-acetyltransferase [Pelosinus sp.]|nr:GNAT family N-acetyltransferase [Pelosinus sp.]